jgi:cell shape-determining protein MreC
VVTSDFSSLEPGVVARKYYAPLVGLFLEVKPNTGEIVPLTDCNFDGRCGVLSRP